MRWKTIKDIKNTPKENDLRYKKKFAWLPICCGFEWRWLETCYIEQKFWVSWHESGWFNERFLTKEEYEKAIVKTEVTEQEKVLFSFLCYGTNCAYWKEGKCNAFNPIIGENGKCITGHPKRVITNDNSMHE